MAPVAVVLVLGDVGRSPRMQYHALSLAEHGYRVHLVGYAGATPPRRLTEQTGITVHALASLPWRIPEGAPRIAFLAYAPIKVLYQVIALLWTLLVVLPRPAVLLVQNPPAIPSLAVAQLACALWRARLVIDWHNYGYTILGLRLGAASLLVRLAARYERWFGRRAGAHLCVTRAMALDLRDAWGVTPAPVVVYDTAPRHFHRLSRAERNEFFGRADIQALFDGVPGGVDAVLNVPTGGVSRAGGADGSSLSQRRGGGGAGGSSKGKGKARATDESPVAGPSAAARVAAAAAAAAAAGPDGAPRNRTVGSGLASGRQFDRTALLVSSTSWTEDEDFSLLLGAAKFYSASATPASAHLCIVVTGQGPLRQHYEAEFAAQPLEHVTFVTAWLAAEDYPRLLGAADLGVCLHTSSSGLDLPMKVVDMYGCGLPVCAVDYACIGELVRDHETGRLFADGEQLGSILHHFFGQGPQSRGAVDLAVIQENVLVRRRDTWEDNWRRTVLPVLRASPP